MILVMSLLEMKKDNTVVKRMFETIKLRLLILNLDEVWRNYKESNNYKEFTLEVINMVSQFCVDILPQ